MELFEELRCYLLPSSDLASHNRTLSLTAVARMHPARESDSASFRLRHQSSLAVRHGATRRYTNLAPR